MSSSRKDVLAEIVENKKAEVSVRKRELPLEKFQSSVTNSSRSLFEALSNDRADFILECKKASPSKGLIRENFDLEEILSEYQDFANSFIYRSTFSSRG